MQCKNTRSSNLYVNAVNQTVPHTKLFNIEWLPPRSYTSLTSTRSIIYYIEMITISRVDERSTWKNEIHRTVLTIDIATLGKFISASARWLSILCRKLSIWNAPKVIPQWISLTSRSMTDRNVSLPTIWQPGLLPKIRCPPLFPWKSPCSYGMLELRDWRARLWPRRPTSTLRPPRTYNSSPLLRF